MPGRQAFLVQMVEDKNDLGNAIALNSSMVNMARLLGPSIAGGVIALFGTGYCFLIDGLSYVPVIASLLMMRLKPLLLPHSAASMFHQLKEGWTYVAGSVPIRTILSLFAVISLMGWPFTVLMPIFALKILKDGPHTYGFLMGAIGVGALASAYSLALRPSARGLIKMMPLSAGMLGARTDTFRLLAKLLVVARSAALLRFWLDAGSGCQQHRHPNHRGGKQARAGDELLHGRVRRHGAVRKLVGWNARQRHRRAEDRNGERSMLRGRRDLVSNAIEGCAKSDPADLREPRHRAGAAGSERCAARWRRAVAPLRVEGV